MKCRATRCVPRIQWHNLIKLCLVRVLQDWAATREGKFSCFRTLSEMEKNGLHPTSNCGKTKVLNETTPLKLDSQLLDNGAYEGGDLNRKCVLTLSIVSVVFNIVVGGTGFVFAFQRNSASIYAFAAECLLDMLSSMIVIWQYLTPHYSFARERIACMLLGLFFILSAIAIISKAMDDLIVRESPTWIPVLIILAGVGAAACFLLALIKLILAKRLGSLSLVLDGINSLISSFCAVAIIVSDLVYDSNPEIWYMDAVLSTVAALIMLLVGAKVLFENWSLGRHGHITLH